MGIGANCRRISVGKAAFVSGKSEGCIFVSSRVARQSFVPNCCIFVSCFVVFECPRTVRNIKVARKVAFKTIRSCTRVLNTGYIFVHGKITQCNIFGARYILMQGLSSDSNIKRTTCIAHHRMMSTCYVIIATAIIAQGISA